MMCSMALVLAEAQLTFTGSSGTDYLGYSIAFATGNSSVMAAGAPYSTVGGRSSAGYVRLNVTRDLSFGGFAGL